MQASLKHPNFTSAILEWYRIHQRDLPWRGSRDPYAVWLSEIIMQQTRVAQGTPYYRRFLERFPEVSDLATASEEEVLKLWQGLGYYSRARNLHAAARKVAFEWGGKFPESYKGLLELPGVGPYTAAAIASICFELPHPVVDGNVFRVLSRYFDVDIPVDTGPGRRHFDQLAREVMDPGQIGRYNQALMEFGALQCVPANPDCASCPLVQSCGAHAAGTIGQRPVKQGKTRIRKRYFHYVMPIGPDLQTLLIRRGGPGIWQGLYEFPLLEQEADPTPAEIGALITTHCGTRTTIGTITRFNDAPRVHKLSHQHLYTTFWLARAEGLPEGALPLSEAEELPVPVLIAEFMDTVKNSYF
ncbi:A/G-specific adenine glycosylase [Robiginitalea biformata]|uniref:Adenine DNA glycosylase n=1 Tax=Robiginitalea biformata (strain ATCC BAA-864 / DSM 15991 / KCTC 12146 / HTCC2501) TaxID=313596 RepID=A4CIT4_ROBBH|nr:A/G-specific adenine glycosylase [Robiginitalea biformata]EAR16842.1 A/G-specific adenine glycosylase [Robiginitalea biformata HTCC2501]